jgi:hypothetical protein
MLRTPVDLRDGHERFLRLPHRSHRVNAHLRWLPFGRSVRTDPFVIVAYHCIGSREGPAGTVLKLRTEQRVYSNGPVRHILKLSSERAELRRAAEAGQMAVGRSAGAAVRVCPYAPCCQ